MFRLGLPWVLLAIASCATTLPAPVPMASVRDDFVAGSSAECLVVFLPGVKDRAGDFARHGFVQALRERKLSVDVVEADATPGYYEKKTVVDRLEVDVLRPARERGFKQVWLVGLSMGGMGSLLYVRQHPEEVTGMFLLAPYLGGKEVLEEISSAGGLERWAPVGHGEDSARDVWLWLKGAAASGASRPEIYLGFGLQDRLIAGHRLLASSLPPARVFRTEGKHSWPAWQRLWLEFLQKSEFSQRCLLRE